MRQRLQTELVLDVSRFGRFGAEKFSPRWHIVKQRTNLDLCPGRFAAVAHRLDPPAVYQNFCAGDRDGLASAQPEARNARDARQRFAPKTKRADSGEISRGSDFAGGVPFERKQGIIAVHAAAIIDDPNARHSAALNSYFDRARTSVNAVLDQFLHHGGGAFHHFAGSHLAGESFGKKLNPTHWITDFRSIRLALLPANQLLIMSSFAMARKPRSS